jgi:hypothetical protein
MTLEHPLVDQCERCELALPPYLAVILKAETPRDRPCIGGKAQWDGDLRQEGDVDGRQASRPLFPIEGRDSLGSSCLIVRSDTHSRQKSALGPRRRTPEAAMSVQELGLDAVSFGQDIKHAGLGSLTRIRATGLLAVLLGWLPSVSIFQCSSPRAARSTELRVVAPNRLPVPGRGSVVFYLTISLCGQWVVVTVNEGMAFVICIAVGPLNTLEPLSVMPLRTRLRSSPATGP